MKYLIVGLGNPGTEYETTRHNVGFMALDVLSDIKDFKFNADRLSLMGSFKYKGRQIYTIKPITYMNLSGNAVRYWLQELKIPVEHSLILTDDIALPLGRLRMREKGSNAGHNGLKSIEECIGTIHYPRLRIGIGNDFHKGQQVNYVLNSFNEEEFKLLPDILKTTSEMILSFCTTGTQRTMTRYNN